MEIDATSPSFSVWVSASAGTGKTKILIDRVLRLLLEGEKNILCLTFTNAAANEMENRIYDILSKWTLCSHNELVEALGQLLYNKVSHYHLTRAKKLFSEFESLSLTIETIHAFCYQLVSTFSIEAAVSPNFTLSECKELHSLAFEKTLNHEMVQDSINAIAAETDENKLRDLLYALCIKRFELEDDLECIKAKLNPPNETRDLPDKIIEHIKKLAEILSGGSKRDQNYSNILYNWYSGTHRKNIKNLTKVFIKSGSYEKRSTLSIITNNILEKFPNVVEIIEETQNAILTHIEEFNAYQIFARTSNLLNILGVYIGLYNDEKSRNALLDYDDIINLATKLLNSSIDRDWILFNLDQKIDHILVDEAQDNSPDQWKIIANLCNEFFAGDNKTLFVVGDIKQSIYRFQGANPALFYEMQRYFYTKTNKWSSFQLRKSFRSTPQILELVDRLFNNFREEISFSDNTITHIPHRENDQGYVEIWPPLPKYKNEQQMLQVHLIHKANYIADQLLAQTIAYKIRNWLDNGRILVAKDRCIEPRDILILIRQRNALLDYVITAFKKANVPIIGRDHFRIMDYIAVQDLIALAEFLLLQTNDLALANVLKSPLFNLSENDLFNIAYNRQTQSLWERLKDYSQNIYNELSDLIKISRTESPLALFTHVLSIGRKKFATRLGLECLEIIDEFMSIVLQFEHPCLQTFIQWIKENSPEVKNDIQSDYNAVRIMTIHKAKGLQSPIVFLIDTHSVPRNSESIVFDEMKMPFWCGENIHPYCDEMKNKKKLEDYKEYLRLLYVALTRAEDELYILGKEPVQKGSWYDVITTYGGPYERVLSHPMHEDNQEVLCINSSYPQIHRKKDHLNHPVIPLPQNLTEDRSEDPNSDSIIFLK